MNSNSREGTLHKYRIFDTFVSCRNAFERHTLINVHSGPESQVHIKFEFHNDEFVLIQICFFFKF